MLQSCENWYRDGIRYVDYQNKVSINLIHKIVKNCKQGMDDLSPRDVLKKLKIENVNKIIIEHKFYTE